MSNGQSLSAVDNHLSFSPPICQICEKHYRTTTLETIHPAAKRWIGAADFEEHEMCMWERISSVARLWIKLKTLSWETEE